jgi:Zinc knuckle
MAESDPTSSPSSSGPPTTPARGDTSAGRGNTPGRGGTTPGRGGGQRVGFVPPPPPPRPSTTTSSIGTTTAAETTIPVRGGYHHSYGIYIGGSPLDDNYQPTREARLRYRSQSQRRNMKTIGYIESAIIAARDSSTSFKFDGCLDPAVNAPSTEIGKDRFITLVSRKVEDLGQETFYYVKNESDEVVDLFEQSHNFTLDAVVAEFEARKVDTHPGAFDGFEFDEIALSRLVVESLLTDAFYEKIVIRFGQRLDFKDLPGSCLFLMALETCNASVSYDVDKAEADFLALKLEDYPGENIADFATEAQRLIKKMGGGYTIPTHTGSRFLLKVSKTECEEFNRKIYALLDPVKDMEFKYKMMDPGKMTKDPKYNEYGPLALLATVQQAYSRLLSFQDWPALASKLPQSNNASSSAAAKVSGANIKPLDGERKCFRCGSTDHHVRDCPKKASTDSKGREKPKDKGVSKDDSDGPSKKAKNELPAWRYLEPKDLTVPLIDGGRTWKFCTKCKCNRTGRQGLYILSHFDADHEDNYNAKNEGNLACVDVPLNVPAATVTEASLHDFTDDIEFQGVGAWCTPIDASAVHFVPSLVERENVFESEEEFDVSTEPLGDEDEVPSFGVADALRLVLQEDPQLPDDWTFGVARFWVNQEQNARQLRNNTDDLTEPRRIYHPTDPPGIENWEAAVQWEIVVWVSFRLASQP